MRAVGVVLHVSVQEVGTVAISIAPSPAEGAREPGLWSFLTAGLVLYFFGRRWAYVVNEVRLNIKEEQSELLCNMHSC